MMDSRVVFARAIDSQFERLGRDATYPSVGDPERIVRVIPRRPESMLALGDDHIHAEDPQFEFRVSEVNQPLVDDVIILDNTAYRIVEEPTLDLHQLVWRVETLAQ